MLIPWVAALRRFHRQDVAISTFDIHACVCDELSENTMEIVTCRALANDGNTPIKFREFPIAFGLNFRLTRPSNAVLLTAELLVKAMKKITNNSPRDEVVILNVERCWQDDVVFLYVSELNF